MNKFISIILSLFLLFYSIKIAYAQDPEWTTSIDVAYSHSKGNSDYKTFEGSYTVVRKTLESTLQEKISSVYTKTNNEITNKISLESDYDYKIDKELYFWTDSLIKIDRPSGIKFESTSFYGIGRKYKVDNFVFRIQTGLGGDYEIKINDKDTIVLANKSSVDLEYNLTKKFTVYGEVNIICSLKDWSYYKSDGEIGWKIKLTKMLSLKNVLEFRYNNTPPIGKLKTDTLFKTLLVLTF